MSTLAAPNVAEFPGKPVYVDAEMASLDPPPVDNGERRRKAFGARLARRRAQLDLTQEQAAQRVGVTHRTYQRWEEGDVMPYLRNQEAAARAFDTSLEELLGAAAAATNGAAGDRALVLQLAAIEDKLDLVLDALAVNPAGAVQALATAARETGDTQDASAQTPPATKTRRAVG